MSRSSHSPELLHALQVLSTASLESLSALSNLDTWKSVEAAFSSIRNDLEAAVDSIENRRYFVPSNSNSSRPIPCPASLTPLSSSNVPTQPPPAESSSTTSPKPVESSSTASPKPTECSSTTNLNPAECSSAASPKPAEFSSTTKKNPEIDWLVKIEKALIQLDKFSKNFPDLNSMLLKQEQKCVDKRIYFLRIVNGSKASKLERFLSGLAQLSCASCFSTWEHTIGYSRIDELCSRLSKVPKKSGRITQYWKIHYSTNVDVVVGGTKQGLRKLAFMELFQFSQQRRADQPFQRVAKTDVAEGILAVLVSLPAFELLTLDKYPNVIKTLSKKTSIIDRIKSLSPWFERLRGDFEHRGTSSVSPIPPHDDPATHVPDAQIDVLPLQQRKRPYPGDSGYEDQGPRQRRRDSGDGEVDGLSEHSSSTSYTTEYPHQSPEREDIVRENTGDLSNVRPDELPGGTEQSKSITQNLRKKIIY
ncbi:hypothetical protein McanCB56680_003838 [Microsporum canis]